MSRWSLEFSKEAELDISQLDRLLRRRIIDKLDWLIDNFDSITPLGLGGDYKDFYKLRVGDWRVVYQIKWGNCKIIVCYIDRRDKIYKRK